MNKKANFLEDTGHIIVSMFVILFLIYLSLGIMGIFLEKTPEQQTLEQLGGAINFAYKEKMSVDVNLLMFPGDVDEDRYITAQNKQLCYYDKSTLKKCVDVSATVKLEEAIQFSDIESTLYQKKAQLTQNTNGHIFELIFTNGEIEIKQKRD